MSYRCHRTIPGLNNSLGDGKPIKQAVRRMAFTRRLVEETLAEILWSLIITGCTGKERDWVFIPLLRQLLQVQRGHPERRPPDS
ncbi:hypothetical protein T10_8811 [Trichinella papuae]|uniref:Uncharacterized protein n=1 Tax=Trichinella papuae TaxID=268474 RepID=A0A0V1MSH9_9BILA|nr:hypothetical protein T10_8811 [Trichinella papuae]